MISISFDFLYSRLPLHDIASHFLIHITNKKIATTTTMSKVKSIIKIYIG
jgi:hypothetical protein